jgi:hypothetical protein
MGGLAIEYLKDTLLASALGLRHGCFVKVALYRFAKIEYHRIMK